MSLINAPNFGLAALLLPVSFGVCVGLHWAVARTVKGVLSAARPLAEGEPAIGGYERRVLGTAGPGLHGLLAALAGAGVLLWLALVVGGAFFWLLLPAALGGALWLDLRLWERVVVGPSQVWFQPGWGAETQRIPIGEVEDLRIQEADAAGFTLRHGRSNRVARLWLRRHDRQLVGLALTDAHTGDEAIEACANRIRERIAQGVSQAALARSEAQAAAAARAVAEAAARGTDAATAEARLALQRLRQQALAPDAPAGTRMPQRVDTERRAD